MIEYNIESFHRRNIETAKKHAIKEFPNESCGIIVNHKYIPCKNIAKDKECNFMIDPIEIIKAEKLGDIQAVVHSHGDYPHASKHDMELQIKNKCPWIIINLKNGNVRDVFAWGDQLPITDYIGRPFFHGVADCYGLVRDYYRKELNITIPIFPREYRFWKKESPAFENVVMEGLEEVGFKIVGSDISDLQLHDGILAKVNSSIINHCGVYIGKGGLLLHHLCLHKNSLSKREPMNIYRNYIGHIVRHKELM